MSSIAPETLRPLEVPLPAYGVAVLESHHGRDFRADIDQHDFFQLLSVLRGAGTLHCPTQTPPDLSLCAGDVVLIPPAAPHRIQDAPHTPLSIYAVNLAPAFLADLPALTERVRRLRRAALSAAMPDLLRRSAARTNLAPRRFSNHDARPFAATLGNFDAPSAAHNRAHRRRCASPHPRALVLRRTPAHFLPRTVARCGRARTRTVAPSLHRDLSPGQRAIRGSKRCAACASNTPKPCCATVLAPCWRLHLNAVGRNCPASTAPSKPKPAARPMCGGNRCTVKSKSHRSASQFGRARLAFRATTPK